MDSENVPLPQPATVSVDEKLAEFDNIPLFMKTLSADTTDDVAISALQSLAFEGPPDEVAGNFKDQGNDYFRGRRYREALGFYTQGVDAKPTDAILQEALLCNRAACNLELKNYRSVLKDCSVALTLNPTSSKAYYRSAMALVALERPEEALDCCDRCLEFDLENRNILATKDKAAKVIAVKEQKAKDALERLAKEREAKLHMHHSFLERNLIATKNPEGPGEYVYIPSFDPEDPTKSTMIFPVFFLYPQHAQSDVVPDFHEDTPFSAHLERMFPPATAAPPWDVKGEYMTETLVIYAMTHRKRLLKVGKKMSLKDVCRAAAGKDGEKDGLELKDGCLSVAVMPKGDVEKGWIAEYKALRD